MSFTLQASRRCATTARTAAIAAAMLAAAGCAAKPEPALRVSVSSLSFAAEQLGPVPEARSVEVSFRGDGLIVGYPPGTEVPTWIVVTIDPVDGARASVSIGVTDSTLSPGAHAAVLRFVTGTADGTVLATRDVTVTYTLTAPAYTLTDPDVALVTEAAKPGDLERSFTLHSVVAGTADAACRWEVSSSEPWVAVTPASGDLSSDAVLTARLDPERLWALPNGYRPAWLSFQLSGCTRTTALRAGLNLYLDLHPAFSAAPVSFAVGADSSTADLARPLDVSHNLGEVFASHARWTAAPDEGWMSTSVASGDGPARLTLELVGSALATLPAGLHTANLVVASPEARIPALLVPVSLDLALPTVQHVAPSATWVDRDSRVVVRGQGFGGAATWPLRVGDDTVIATTVSDGELRATIPARASAARLPVSIGNALDVERGGSELVVLPRPGYTPTVVKLAHEYRSMVIDPEREAILLVGFDEVLRIRHAAGGWQTEHVPLESAAGAALSVDGRKLLVFTGIPHHWEIPRAVVELDASSLETLSTSPVDEPYAMYSLIAPLGDGTTLLVDAEGMGARWFPGFAPGPNLTLYAPSLLLTRDRSHLFLRPESLGGSYGPVRTFDAGEDVFRTRYTPADGGVASWDVSDDGDRLVDGLDVLDRDFASLGRLALPEPDPSVAAVSPDGSVVYTIASSPSGAWVLRRTDVRADSGPYAADAEPLPLTLPAAEFPWCLKVSGDGSALFLLTYQPGANSDPGTTRFRVVPLP